MPKDVSIYAIALEWLRVPSYLMPGVIIALALLGFMFLRNSRLGNIKTKRTAVAEARQRIERINEHLDSALRELISAAPRRDWEPPDLRQGKKISPRGMIDPGTDERCRRLIGDISRICDAHLPEYRQQVLGIENQIRAFAQRRLELLSRRDTLFRLESELAALRATELEAITQHGTGRGWGDTFNDPLRIPMEKRAVVVSEGQLTLETALRDHEEIADRLSRLYLELSHA